MRAHLRTAPADVVGRVSTGAVKTLTSSSPQAPKPCGRRHQELGEARWRDSRSIPHSGKTFAPHPDPPRWLALGTSGEEEKKALAQAQPPKCHVTPQFTSQVAAPTPQGHGEGGKEGKGDTRFS